MEDIARFFGLSPLLLGETKNLGNIEEVQNLFLLHTLQPYITMVEEEFNRKLLKPSEGNLQINLDETYLLRTNKEAQANFYGKLLDKGVLSINEVRSELGYNVIDGGDRHFIPYTDINQNTLNGNKIVSE
nr:MAG TPA: portal protein [Caudoviricetes sp.]